MDLIYIVSDDSIRGNLIYSFLSGRLKCALIKPSDLHAFADKENPQIFLFISNTFDYLKTQTVWVRETPKFYNHGVICVLNNPTIHQQRELFEIGSDMVLTQHTEMERIYLECYALHRRMNGFQHSATVQFGPYIIDFLKNEIQHEGRFIEVEPIHTKMIKLFFEHANQLVTRKHMKDVIWKDQEISHRSIDAQISKFKKKFPELGELIESVYGQGYVFRTDKSEQKVG
jgi:DNA-binding response OmpR family regulator